MDAWRPWGGRGRSARGKREPFRLRPSRRPVKWSRFSARYSRGWSFLDCVERILRAPVGGYASEFRTVRALRELPPLGRHSTVFRHNQACLFSHNGAVRTVGANVGHRFSVSTAPSGASVFRHATRSGRSDLCRASETARRPRRCMGGLPLPCHAARRLGRSDGSRRADTRSTSRPLLPVVDLDVTR